MDYRMCECHPDFPVEITMEADMDADPFWCSRCGNQLEWESIPLTDAIKHEVMVWASKYGEWINWEQDALIENGIKLEEAHNQEGQRLAQKVCTELGEKFSVTFYPSMSARFYNVAKYER